MSGFRKIIANIFENHGFDEDFYGPWFSILGRVDSVELVSVIETLEESSEEELRMYTNNLHDKIDSLHSSNVEEWKEAVVKEVDYIKSA